ncbi:MAG: glutathione S-transferase family protein [Rhodospirillaceae bacterium]|jgi:glutathione S-transferase|nr:glutathione S-transferase family protein [Rhodospirillaceae bacterium]MBT6116513.1 glutathione S-transferase family protein [Rhodospirillaceae bacterium]
MKLYGFPPSPNTWKVRALAAHLDIPLEFEMVDLTQGDQRTPGFLALNPAGRTPVLVDGDFALWESEAILQYLAGLRPTPLWPENAQMRADIMRWQSWRLAHWGKDACEPLVFERVVKRFMDLGLPDEAAVATAMAAFEREATVLDGHLATRPFLVGDGPTIAEFSVASMLFMAEMADLPLAPYPNIRAWFARAAALPGWAETAPPAAEAA